MYHWKNIFRITVQNKMTLCQNSRTHYGYIYLIYIILREFKPLIRCANHCHGNDNITIIGNDNITIITIILYTISMQAKELTVWKPTNRNGPMIKMLLERSAELGGNTGILTPERLSMITPIPAWPLR